MYFYKLFSLLVYLHLYLVPLICLMGSSQGRIQDFSQGEGGGGVGDRVGGGGGGGGIEIF